MDNIIELLKTDNFLLILLGTVAVLLIGFIILIVKVSFLNKKYISFMKKIGNGKNIEEDLENYMHRVNRVEKQNVEIKEVIESINKNMNNCIQKIGIVRYNAFKDTGSDLSFALAMLDEKNNGVVLNGIYSREMSNIYAKPVENGVSKYTISDEEKEAIQRAIEDKGIYEVK